MYSLDTNLNDIFSFLSFSDAACAARNQTTKTHVWNK